MVSWAFVECDEVESTQSLAAALADKGAPEGTAVTAKSQSAGRGRLGRGWVSPPGGLYMSVILRPPHIERPQLISLVFALAVVEGIGRLTGLAARIRWPNDVIVDGRKVGGVIAAGQLSGKEATRFVVGVGVNGNAPVRRVEPGGEQATSLSEELGREVGLLELRSAILDSFSGLYERWKSGEDLAPLWAGSVGTVGKSVRVKRTGETDEFHGKAVGVGHEGELVVERGGKRTSLRAEDLERLRELN